MTPLRSNRTDLNRRLAAGSQGDTWTPRITENQLHAIGLALGSRPLPIDRDRLRAYVDSGDRGVLTSDEQATLTELTMRAKAEAVTDDDVKRMWPRKVAVVALGG